MKRGKHEAPEGFVPDDVWAEAERILSERQVEYLRRQVVHVDRGGRTYEIHMLDATSNVVIPAELRMSLGEFGGAS